MSDTFAWIFAAHALLFVVLGLCVIYLRITGEVGIGDGGNPQLKRAIRAHANFAEWIPIALMALGLAELRGVSESTIGILGGLLLLSRVGHAIGLNRSIGVSVGRTGGMTLMFIVMAVTTVMAALA